MTSKRGENTIIISLGGSIICPQKVDTAFLKKFKEIILSILKKGNTIVIVTGGGKIARDYITSSEKISSISDHDKDLIGIRATKINAELLRSIFSKKAYKNIIEDPTKKIKTNKKIIIASGWKPGFSSDMDAVLLAQNLGSHTVINMSNIDYVYDKDPKRYKSAKKLTSMSWQQLKDLVGDRWNPGLNLPFDPIATKKASQLKLRLYVIGNDIKNLKDLLEKKPFKGTIIG